MATQYDGNDVMDDEDEMEKFEEDKDGIPIIKRQYVNVPKEIRKAFVADLFEQVRKPADLIAAILVMHYRERATRRMLKEGSQGESRIPSYVTRTQTAEAAQDKPRSADR